MIVQITSRTESELEEHDYRDSLLIKVDGEIKFNVSDGEPEDANLSRDFSDCFGIGNLMKLAYDAGKNDETFSFEEIGGDDGMSEEDGD